MPNLVANKLLHKIAFKCIDIEISFCYRKRGSRLCSPCTTWKERLLSCCFTFTSELQPPHSRVMMCTSLGIYSIHKKWNLKLNIMKSARKRLHAVVNIKKKKKYRDYTCFSKLPRMSWSARHLMTALAQIRFGYSIISLNLVIRNDQSGSK